MFVVNHRKFFYIFSSLLVVGSILALIFWGLNFSIDFKGGSSLEIDFPSGRPALSDVQKELAPLNLEATVQPTSDNGFIIQTKSLTEAEHDTLLTTLSNNGAVKTDVKQFNTIGPVLGAELRSKSIISIVLVILAIVLFITYAFRHVSEPVSSWKYGLVAIIALVHDVVVPTGVASVLGHYAGFQVDTLFVTAILTILGFSIHDTIVVFDRTRENLKGHEKEPFEQTVGKSISQTFTRSINTSLTVVLTLLALYFLGSTTTQNFALTMLVGIIAGTYSSIFLGSPLLVTLQKMQEKKASK